MKKLMILAALISSTSAFASRPATPGEIRLVCQAEDRALTNMSADGAVRMTECYASKGTATHLSPNRTEVSVLIPMYIEGRKGDNQCSVVYRDHSAHARNIEGGDANVSCQ